MNAALMPPRWLVDQYVAELRRSGVSVDSMSTWEDRMAARAAERAAAREAAQAEIDFRYPEKSGRPGHESHHLHAEGAATLCSCGEFLGVASFIPDSRLWSDDPAEVAQAQREEADERAWITCRVCGQHGVMLHDDAGTWPPRRLEG